MTITSGAAVSPSEEPDQVAARLVAQGSTTPVLVPTPAPVTARGITVGAAPVLAAPVLAGPTDTPVDGRSSPSPAADAARGISVQRAPAEHEVESVTVDVTPPPSTGDRIRAALRGPRGSRVPGPGLTSMGGVLLGTLVAGLGLSLDLSLGPELGVGFAVAFVVAALLVVLTVRPAALVTAVVLPPLLYAAARVLESRHSGQTHGQRELVLDVATSLALHAPVLLITTALVAGIALLRGLAHSVRRARR